MFEAPIVYRRWAAAAAGTMKMLTSIVASLASDEADAAAESVAGVDWTLSFAGVGSDVACRG